MLKEEEIAISKLINKENITVRNYAEGQTSFDKGIYYKFSNGLYMEVLEAGGERPVAEKTRVNVRFEGYIFNKDSLLSRCTAFHFDQIGSGLFAQRPHVRGLGFPHVFARRWSQGTPHHPLYHRG